MQFNDRKSRLDSAVRTNANGHLALDREVGKGVVLQRFSGILDFTAEKTRVNRTAHAELLDHAGSDAADLVSHDRIAALAAQTGNTHLTRLALAHSQPTLPL